MSLRTRVTSWLRVALSGRRLEREMEQEWRFHLDSRIDALVAEGHALEEAERLAWREFGDLQRWKEEGRQARGFALIDGLRFDLRYALRQMWRTPGFTLAIVAIVALAVGVNTALFSVVNAVLVRPLPYVDPDRVVRLWEVTPQGDDHNVVSRGNYLDWREQATSFEELGAHTMPYGMALTGTGEPSGARVVQMSASAFRALGVSAALGRIYDTPDLQPAGGDGRAVALVSDGFWHERFGADPGIVGRVVHLNDQAYTVVGVLPRGFAFPSPTVQIWVPAAFGADDRNERRSHNWHVIARLNAGTSGAAANSEMRAIADKTARLFPEFMEGWSVNVAPLHQDLVGDVRPLLLALASLALGALVAAAANLASLLLARARRRETEYAVRAAIGAGRGRLVRQVVTEALALGGVGGICGVVMVAVALPLILAAVPSDIPLIERVSIDRAVLAFAAVLTLVTAVGVGLAPALRVARADLTPSLQRFRTPADARSGRARSALLVAQFALSATLLVAAALLARSVARLAAVDHGFDPQRLVEGMLDLPRARYPDQVAQERVFSDLLARFRAMPGVEVAALATDPPLSGSLMTFGFTIEGRPASNPSGREQPVSLVAVSPGYFETLGLPVLQGRSLLASDRRGSPRVIVVNRRLADRFWAGSTPVGHRLSFTAGGPTFEIVGVVGDIRDQGLDQPASPAIYVPFEHRQDNWGWMSWQALVVRVGPGLEPASLAPALRAAIWSVDSSLPLLSFHTVEGLYAESAARRRFAMQLASGFAGLALVLCLVGVFGVVAYSVGEREREIGVRLALGARAGQVLALLMRSGLGPSLAGIGIGTAAAAALTRLLQPLLFSIDPIDLPTFGAMAALLATAAAIAAWVPARRATRIDPARNLRAQ